MTSTTEELQKYVGQSFSKVKQELESQGYSVREIRLGTYTTGGRVSMRPYLSILVLLSKNKLFSHVLVAFDNIIRHVAEYIFGLNRSC
ncbi:unnamed protein product [Rotaria sp. Silwood1]|nr:unnamed protein product [Rotaria sp. Silwood1]CAF1497555.1 unnamed protein product [Rotaria sp. Silwood1]CAF4729381.1 unnamed protein product [Rotaria sp. Silwood1]